jgi:DNA-binding response OmpR family regulator
MKPDLITALIVDDDEVVCRMLSFALEKEGFDCLCSSDGADAIATLEAATFDLVITDLLMPKTHGHALAIHLLERAERPIIVVHTSVLEPKLAKDLMLRGIDDIVFKPTDYRALAAKMKSLVTRRRRLQTGISEVMSMLGIKNPNIGLRTG